MLACIGQSLSQQWEKKCILSVSLDLTMFVWREIWNSCILTDWKSARFIFFLFPKTVSHSNSLQSVSFVVMRLWIVCVLLVWEPFLMPTGKVLNLKWNFSVIYLDLYILLIIGWVNTWDFGTYSIVELQRHASRAANALKICANALAFQSICCSHTENVDADMDPG